MQTEQIAPQVQIALNSNEEAKAANHRYITAYLQKQKLQAEIAQRKRSIDATYDIKLAEIDQEIANTQDLLKVYFEDHRSEALGKAKSTTLVKGCSVGFRKMPLKVEIETKDEDALKAELTNLDPHFLTIKTTVNFDKSYILKKIADDAALKQDLFQLGISVKEEESFFIKVEI